MAVDGEVSRRCVLARKSPIASFMWSRIFAPTPLNPGPIGAVPRETRHRVLNRFGLLGRQGWVEAGERGCPWEFWWDVVGSPSGIVTGTFERMGTVRTQWMCRGS